MVSPILERGFDHIERGFHTRLALLYRGPAAVSQAQAACGRCANRIDLQRLALDLRGGDGLLRPFGELQRIRVRELQAARC